MNDYDICYTTGIPQDLCCEFCKYKNECSGNNSEEEEDYGK